MVTSERLDPPTVPVGDTRSDQRRAWDEGTLPTVERVRPDLWSIPVPIPNNPLRYTLAYALGHPGGLTLIDPGWDAPESWQALLAGIASTGYEISDVVAVLATHVHPDHYGLAGKVRQASGAWVGLHAADAALLRTDQTTGLPAVAAAARSLFQDAGAPPLELPRSLTRSALASFVPTTEPDRLLADGELLDFGSWSLRVLHTPGHSPGHVCLRDATQRLLFTGDHVLPQITGTVGLHSNDDDDALGDFLASLATLNDIAFALDEVLPAHEYRFTGLARRIEEVLTHHEQRLDETAAAVEHTPGRSAWDIAQQLTWSRPWSDIDTLMRRLAAAETLAHLQLLRRRLRVDCSAQRPWRWDHT